MRLNLDWKPRKPFYGWWIVGASFLIALYMGGVIFYGFTAFIEPIVNEFGWSYTQVSIAASLRGLEMGLLAPLVGILVDRWGPRRLLFGGVIIASLGLILLSRTTSLAMYYSAFILIATGMSACASTVLMTAIANWFRRKIGIAMGITACGFAFGGLLIPVVVNLIDMYDWRMALVIIAMGMLVVCLPLSLLIRHKPDQYGYQPDGEAENAATFDNSLVQAKTSAVELRTRLALKSATFWHISLAMLCNSLMLNAVITHIMPYLSSIGISRAKSSLVASAMPLISTGGRLGLGSLGDTIDRRRLMAGAFAMMSLGLLCLGLAASGANWMLIPFLILFGTAYGGNHTLRSSAIREFFGRNNFGAIHGFMMGIMMLGNIAGAPLAGWVFDNWGTYQPIWFVFTGLGVVALVTVVTTPLVNHHGPA